jgi:hypothetical protein
MTPFIRLNLARLMIGVVLAWNILAALSFILNPAAYAPGFELAGIPGAAAIRGVGVLFLMWNVPYMVALWHPVRHRISLYESLAMQVIGVFGESLIYLSIPVVYAVTRQSLARFIAFDSIGLLLLILSVVLAQREMNHRMTEPLTD